MKLEVPNGPKVVFYHREECRVSDDDKSTVEFEESCVLLFPLRFLQVGKATGGQLDHKICGSQDISEIIQETGPPHAAIKAHKLPFWFGLVIN